jgi:GNAT superfamily N-acetyltransferase
MSAEIIIRDLANSDRAGWEALWAGYLAFYEQSVDPAVTELTWARLNDPAEPMFALAAQQGSDLVGFAHCILHRGTWSLGDLCYLEDLFVASGMRGQGVGRKLIEAVYAKADAASCERVYWLTHENNLTARALYDKIGKLSGFVQYRR